MRIFYLQLCILFAVFSKLIQAGLSVEQMNALVKSNNYKVMPLNELNYKEILSGPRDYHTVVMLSSQSSQFNCVLCREFKPEFDLIGNSWYKDHPEGFKQNLDESDEKEAPRNIYFFYSEFMESRKFFQELQLSSIPKIAYYPPTAKKASVREYEDYQFYSGDHKLLLIEWLKGFTGYTYNLYIPVDYSRVVMNAFIAFTLFFFTRKYFGGICKVFTSKILWRSISLIGILMFISGYMFNQIRGVPLLLETQEGKSYFVPSLQNQLGMETQITSFIYGSLGFLVIALVNQVPSIKQPQVKFFAVLLLSALIYVMFSILLMLFRFKANGYPYKLLTFHA